MNGPEVRPDPPRLLTASEAVAMLHVTASTLRRWASTDPPAIRTTRTLGGHRRFYAEDIERMLATPGDPR